MGRWYRRLAVASLVAGIMLAGAAERAMAQPRAHVYLFRGLADVFSRGMDTLADELDKRGVDATSHSHTDWKSIAAKVAANYKAGKEGPIIIVGHSLGADAAMEMADYLGDKGVPVALVVPFDATQSFPVPGNVARVINFTQRDYAFMRPGPGFRGSLKNVDLRADPNIGHLNIDEAPALHSQVISAVLAIAGGHAAPIRPGPASVTQHGAHEPSGERSSKSMPTILPDQKPAARGTSITPSHENSPAIPAQPKPAQRPAMPVAPPSPPPKAPAQIRD